MKRPSTKMIALHLQRKEAAACRAFERASELADARILAAVEGLRPFREKLAQARLERAAFLGGPVGEDAEGSAVESGLAALAFSIDVVGQGK